MKLQVLDQKGKQVQEITVNKAVFGVDANPVLVHEVAVAQQNNARQGTKSTLTRSEVRGHAKKPYRQKGTGRARHGSTKSPIHEGGGVAFAPKPRDFTTKINKQKKHTAFKVCISSKVADGELIVLNDTKLKDAKTKSVAKLLENLKLDAKRVLFVTNGLDAEFVRCSANLPNASTTTAAQLSVVDMVNNRYIVASVEAIKSIEEAYAS